MAGVSDEPNESRGNTQLKGCISSVSPPNTCNQEVAYDRHASTKTTLVHAPIEKVWRAVSDHREFGTWFKVDLDGPFVAGQRSTGKMTYPGFEGYPVAGVGHRGRGAESPRLRLDPGRPDARPIPRPRRARRSNSGSQPEGDGTRVHDRRIGLRQPCPSRCAKARLRGNTEGWDIQTENLREYAEARAEA